MADRGGIQLLPETRKKIEMKVPGENRWLFIGAVVAVVSVVAYLGIHAYTRSQEDKLAGLDGQLKQIESKRDKKAEEDLLALKRQASTMSQLLANHIFMTQALQYVERLTQPDLELKSFSASVAKEQITFNASAVTYTTIARQIASFTSDAGVKDLVISNIRSVNTGRFEFGMELKFDPSKVLKKSASQ